MSPRGLLYDAKCQCPLYLSNLCSIRFMQGAYYYRSQWCASGKGLISLMCSVYHDSLCKEAYKREDLTVRRVRSFHRAKCCILGSGECSVRGLAYGRLQVRCNANHTLRIDNAKESEGCACQVNYVASVNSVPVAS